MFSEHAWQYSVIIPNNSSGINITGAYLNDTIVATPTVYLWQMTNTGISISTNGISYLYFPLFDHFSFVLFSLWLLI